MRNITIYLTVACIVAIFVFSCENPGYYEGGEGGDGVPRYTIRFGEQNDRSVLFYTNDERMMGPPPDPNDPNGGGYTYWVRGDRKDDIMNEFRVRVKKVSGNADGGFGVIFALQEKEVGDKKDDFWVLFINKDGEYKFGKVINEEFSPSMNWSGSEHLKKGYDVENTIGITYNSEDEEYTIFFNEQEVITFDDHGDEENGVPPFKGGYYGYICEVDGNEDFPETPVEVRYYQEIPGDIEL